MEAAIFPQTSTVERVINRIRNDISADMDVDQSSGELTGGNGPVTMEVVVIAGGFARQ